MRHVHDRGGWPDVGAVNPTEHNYTVWEKRIHALMRVLTGHHLFRVDEMRRTIESMTLHDYETLSYYERWITAIEHLMIEKGVLTCKEIEERIAQVETL